MINVNDLSNELDINVKAINNHLSILETLGVIFFEHSYSNNLLKRTIKKPKLYFWDLGLATHIINWGNYEVVRDSAMSGRYFENFVISELKKNFINSKTKINTYGLYSIIESKDSSNVYDNIIYVKDNRIEIIDKDLDRNLYGIIIDSYQGKEISTVLLDNHKLCLYHFVYD